MVSVKLPVFLLVLMNERYFSDFSIEEFQDSFPLLIEQRSKETQNGTKGPLIFKHFHLNCKTLRPKAVFVFDSS